MPINAHQNRRDTVHDTVNKTYSPLLMIIYAVKPNLDGRVDKSIGKYRPTYYLIALHVRKSERKLGFVMFRFVSVVIRIFF